MNVDDRQLLVRTRDGDEPAARLLWERHAPGLLALARAVLPRWLAAEDVVQGVFCRVVGMERRVLAGVEDVRAWLAQSVRREALTAIRAARRERARRGARAAGAGASGVGAVVGDELRRAVDALPRRLREVVVLKHVAGLTFDQVAAALEMNRNTAAGRYRTAIDLLRESLARADFAAAGRAETVEVGRE